MGMIGFGVFVLIIAGVISAGLGGFAIPLPSNSETITLADGSTGTIVVHAPRWPFMLGLPVGLIALLYMVAAIRLQRHLRNAAPYAAPAAPAGPPNSLVPVSWSSTVSLSGVPAGDARQPQAWGKATDESAEERLESGTNPQTANETQLALVYEPRAPYQVHDRGTKFRIGAHNSGANPARNVYVRLEGVEPPPHDPVFRKDFPYQLPRMGQALPDVIGCQISPGETEYFEAIETWVSGEGVQIVDGLDTRPDARSLHDKLQIDPEESWLLHYRLSSDNAKSKEATFKVQFLNGVLWFYREDGPIKA